MFNIRRRSTRGRVRVHPPEEAAHSSQRVTQAELLEPRCLLSGSHEIHEERFAPDLHSSPMPQHSVELTASKPIHFEEHDLDLGRTPDDRSGSDEYELDRDSRSDPLRNHSEPDHDDDDPLMGHFALGKGTGAPPPLADCDPIEINTQTVEVQSITSSGGLVIVSKGPPRPPAVHIEARPPAADAGWTTINVTGANYQINEVVIFAPPPQGAGGETRGFGQMHIDAPGPGANPPRPGPREPHVGGASASVPAEHAVAPPHAEANRLAASVATGERAMMQAVLGAAMSNARAFGQAAVRGAQAARTAPELFTTSVIASSGRDPGSAILTPVAMTRGPFSLPNTGLPEVAANQTSPERSGGAIVAANSVLRLLRSLVNAAPVSHGSADAEAAVPQAQSSWDAPMFMSAELLGLAPTGWINAGDSTAQRTLRWIAAGSFIVTVAGCGYCAVTTARARRAAMDEAMDSTLHVMF